ncbi:MAG: TatD family hydrolase [Bacteroidota bacterium]
MTLTDTHCHLDFEKFDEDRTAVILRAIQAGLARILIPALDWESSLAAVRLAASHPILYAAVGFHPTDAGKWQEGADRKLRHLIDSGNAGSPFIEIHGFEKIVAIGEIGLDYYWVSDPDERAWQRRVLEQQLALARQVSRPVIIHMREQGDAWSGEASLDLLAILGDWQRGLAAESHPLASGPGVLHSFNGTLETARKAISLNFLIGVTGPVTYKNADKKREVIRELPLDRLLIETDSPFLTPVPHRGRRNEPAYVVHIADKIAEIHSKDPAEIASITTANAARLFAWGD